MQSTHRHIHGRGHIYTLTHEGALTQKGVHANTEILPHAPHTHTRIRPYKHSCWKDR